MTTMSWWILGSAVGVGALWSVIVVREFCRLRNMHRETMERIRLEEKARK